MHHVYAYVCVCVCVCVYVHAYVCIVCVHVYACIYMSVHACMCRPFNVRPGTSGSRGKKAYVSTRVEHEVISVAMFVAFVTISITAI